MEKPVLFSVEDSIALITLNRPERHNAICQALLVELYNSIDEVAKRDDIKVAVLTGNGRSFCSGIDLDVIGKDNLLDPRGDGKDLPDVLAGCNKPMIGAINGATITGGFELALNLDFLIASENARFIDSHAKVGIHPGWGMTQLLQQAVGQRMAKQMSFTCQPLSAQDALRCGLVNEVLPLEQLLPRALEIARHICSVNQDILYMMRDLIKKRNSLPLDNAYRAERESFHDFLRRMKVL
ncbi:MAG: enoyl-CoA hydratase/isomerase family protein [Deltaproteobacteria bacterium]|nr:enoyl-CoA hydratase/isomerase family protein [Deltaproteobacteria bacterium]